MSDLFPAVLTLAMIAAATLLIGGVKTLARDRQRGVLMIVAALVLVGNVLVWTV